MAFFYSVNLTDNDISKFRQEFTKWVSFTLWPWLIMISLSSNFKCLVFIGNISLYLFQETLKLEDIFSHLPIFPTRFIFSHPLEVTSLSLSGKKCLILQNDENDMFSTIRGFAPFCEAMQWETSYLIEPYNLQF